MFECWVVSVGLYVELNYVFIGEWYYEGGFVIELELVDILLIF